MKLINVPHYLQPSHKECQAACAAMVLDYWSGRADGGDPERIGQLLEQFSLGFRPEAGDIPPAITGLVGMGLARSGLAVDFYSTQPDGGGVEGLNFLTNGWNFTKSDVERYAEHAASTLSKASEIGLTIESQPVPEAVLEAAIAAGKPAVMIIDLQVLKDWPRSANHAVVVTGIDDEFVAIQDPADVESHRCYERAKFFAAHFRAQTDCDAYITVEPD